MNNSKDKFLKIYAEKLTFFKNIILDCKINNLIFVVIKR